MHTISTETNPTKSPRTTRGNKTEKSDKSIVTDKSKHESQENHPTATITTRGVNSNGHNPSTLTLNGLLTTSCDLDSHRKTSEKSLTDANITSTIT